MIKKLIKREDEVTCTVCGVDGERLTFNDGTSQVEHPKKYNDVVQQYVTPVCKE